MGGGTVHGPPVSVLGDGSSTTRFNIVMTGDGFLESDLSDFHDRVEQVRTQLQAENWWPVLGSAINVWRLDVSSNQRGADDPDAGISADTYFDSKYGSGDYAACLLPSSPRVHEALGSFPWHAVLVIVNVPNTGGGCADIPQHICGMGIQTGWDQIALHELSHAAFGLGDEYDRSPATPSTAEPTYPNITANTDPATLKWRALRTRGTPVPTMRNPDCGQRDSRPSPFGAEPVIGLFEGALAYNCGRHRPAHTCKMRVNVGPLCRVCVDAVWRTLTAFEHPHPVMQVLVPDHVASPGVTTAVEIGHVPPGGTGASWIDVHDLRPGWPGELHVTLTSGTGAHPASASGSVSVAGPSSHDHQFEVAVPGQITATLDWSPTTRPFDFSGPIGAGGVSPTTTSHQIQVTADGTISAQLDWGVAPPLNLDLRLYDPGNNLVRQSSQPLPTDHPESLSYPVGGVTGTYRLEVVNNTPVAGSYTLTGSHPAYADLGLTLRRPTGPPVASAPAATRPAILNHTAAADGVGTHILTVTAHSDDASYNLSYTYPVTQPLAPPFAYGAGTETAFTLPAPVLEPFTSRLVPIVFTAPASGGPDFTSQVEVTTPDDPADAPVLMSVHARVVPATSQPLTVVNVAAPHINTFFDPDGTIIVADWAPALVLPGTMGAGFVQSRQFPRGVAGTVGADLYPFLYRIDARRMTSLGATVCVGSLTLDFGPVTPLDYAGTGPAHVFVITQGGLGTVVPSSAEQVGDQITLHFAPGVCTGPSGSPLGSGQTSYFIGLASQHPPHDSAGQVRYGSGELYVLPARTPAHP